MEDIKRTLCGVGYIGNGKYKSKIKGVKTPQYIAWHSMINRCYNEKSLARKPYYSGCEVCEEWHNFQVFAEWFDRTRPEGKFELDKDIKSGKCKIYSPETCSWVTRKENTKKAHAKRCKLVSPSGEIFDVYDVKEFAMENNLNQGHLNQVSLGNENQHKGWTLYKDIPTE